MAEKASALRMKAITKTFPGVKALSDVNFSVDFGRIHAIVGENGAGKSTLMKILGGVHLPTSGTTEVDGVEVILRKPADAQRHGIRMVHQEINLVPDLSVAENIFLGRMPKKGLFVDKVRMVKSARSVLDEIGATIDPRVRVGNLTIGQQQLVEIAKAYSAEPKIIVLDEPTSSLSEHETAALLRILRRMRASGIAIIYISHRLKEVLSIADDVTILRDGAMIDTRTVDGMTPSEMIKLMVGRDVTNIFPKIPSKIGAPVLQVSGLGDGLHFNDISFVVHAGEILGLTGLVGAGRSEVARAIFGLAPFTAGQVEMCEAPVHIASPADAVRAGIAYVPEDRKGDGIIPEMVVRENISLPVLPGMSRMGQINMPKDRELAAEKCQELSIVPSDPERKVSLLSGGNQQKAVIAKWLSAGPKVLILDEPTRGVDVGAKAEIHRIIGELVAGGMAVVMISSELPEIMGVSDRVVVMRDGRASDPIERAAMTEQLIMAHATGETVSEVAT